MGGGRQPPKPPWRLLSVPRQIVHECLVTLNITARGRESGFGRFALYLRNTLCKYVLVAVEVNMKNADIIAALREAGRGPQLGDLDNAPYLSEWWLVYEPTKLIKAKGNLSGHPTIDDPFVTTSPVLGFDLKRSWMRTRNRWYRLGQVARDAWESVQAGHALVYADRRILLLDMDPAYLEWEDVQSELRLLINELSRAGLRGEVDKIVPRHFARLRDLTRLHQWKNELIALKETLPTTSGQWRAYIR